jgi:ABC-type multidrug transport system fused ATPase/permease subunit
VKRLRARAEWRFFAVLPRADRRLAAVWWAAVIARGVLPALFAIVTGWLVGAVQAGHPLAAPLTLTGVVFVALQVLSPIQTAVSANLGDRTSAWLNDRLAVASVGPPGLGHLEDAEIAADLTLARDFDLGIQGPPLSLALDFIALGLIELIGGLASAAVLAGFRWWAPLVLGGAWLATHWLLRESAVWRDRNTPEVRSAQRDSDYAYRLAVDPPAAKELRLFGLVGWTIERFTARRRRLHELQYRATKLREKPVLWSLLLVLAANIAVFWSLASAASGGLGIGPVVVFAQAAVGTGMIAFGGLNWALDGAAAPVAAVLRLDSVMAACGALERRPDPQPADGLPAAELRFRDVTFAYPSADSSGSARGGRGGAGAVADEPVLADFNLTIPAGSSLAIVGRNGSGKTTLAKLLCRLYDPQSGAIEVDGLDLREIDLAGWRSRVAAVFQDFTRFELPLRDNVAPAGAPDEHVREALAAAGAAGLAELDTVLARGYEGGIDLSGGQWQRIALARALCAMRLGAGVVLLDEPTAQLDVRGEAEIFDRILEATRGCTTILISHRFSTVRHADRICVVERGKVVELGSHDELIALGGRYRKMFDLQARPFSIIEGEEELEHDVLT